MMVKLNYAALRNTKFAIVFSLLYGIICFLVFSSGSERNTIFTDTFSLTFLAIVPFTMGLIIAIFINPISKNTLSKAIISNLAVIFSFLVISLFYERNNAIFALAILIPYIIFSIIGLVLGNLIVKQNWYSPVFIVVVVLFPVICTILEKRMPEQISIFEVENTEEIIAVPPEIWKNVVRVKPILKSEYPFSLINWLGIPKPLYAELDKDTLGAKRIGHFEGGLEFRESVSVWDRNRYVEFHIQIEPSRLSKDIFNHQVLRGKHFKFLKAYYKIDQIKKGTCRLTLFSSYQLSSHISWYAGLWGNFLLSDFQQRLLVVIKNRCEN